MKDLIAKLKSDANVALGAIWLHIDAQTARIAKLEEENARLSASWRGDATVADAFEERIIELEAQIAAASAPVVKQQPIGYLRQSEIDKLADHRVAGVGMMLHKEPGEGKIAVYAEPQPADTDKLLEVWTKDAEEFGSALNEAGWEFIENAPHGSVPAILFNNLKPVLRAAILKYAEKVSVSPALQAPVREVPEVNDAKYSEAEKVREAILNIEVSTSGSKGYAKAWNEGSEHMRDAVVNLFDIMVMQAFSQQWIDVEDRLPEDHQDVLVYHCPSAVPSDKECYWVNECSFYRGRFELPNVTHWMPLPAAPVQEPKP